MFSSRTDWDFRASPLFALVEQKRSRGENILDITESNPTKCGLLFEPEQLFPPISLGASVRYDPDPKGLLPARNAVAEWYRRQGVLVDPARIVLTSSTSEAYSFLFKLLCNVGDSVAVPRPSYPLFEYLCRLNDVGCLQYRLMYDGEWHFDKRSVEQVILPSTKALVLVHPNNPTGSFVKSQERESIVDLLKDRSIALIADEVFNRFPFAEDGQRCGTFAATPENLTFTLNGISKILGLPQMKLAWIVVSGQHDECAEAMQRLEVIADSYLSVATQVQTALGSLLARADETIARIRARVSGNFEEIRKELPANSSVSVLRCEGGWNAILRLPTTRSDEEWAMEVLDAQNVLTHPGSLFDFETKSCLVVSLLPEKTYFTEGIRRVVAMVEK
jgi:aspartate/methionine/tyrosine aminotransferase